MPSAIPILFHFPIFTVPYTLRWPTIRPQKWDLTCPILNCILLMLYSLLNFASSPTSKWTRKGLQLEATSPRGNGEFLPICPCRLFPQNNMGIISTCTPTWWWGSCRGLVKVAVVHQSKRDSERWSAEWEGIFSHCHFLQEWNSTGNLGFASASNILPGVTWSLINKQEIFIGRF